MGRFPAQGQKSQFSKGAMPWFWLKKKLKQFLFVFAKISLKIEFLDDLVY